MTGRGVRIEDRQRGREKVRAKCPVKNIVGNVWNRQTAGVECRKHGGVLDEIPGACKDIDTVMANQADLVEVVHTLEQVLCVKGG